MADKNKGAGKGGAPDKSEAGSAGKKPTPILDLKATEVRGVTSQRRDTTSERAKFATSNLKGAPQAKSQAAADASGGQTQPQSGTSGAKSADEKAAAATGAAASGIPAMGGSRGSAEAGPGGGKPDDAAKAASGAGGGNGGQKAAAPPPPVRRSGGGFFLTLTHLVAGIIGGGIALYAAGPLEKELGYKITPELQVPAQIEQRLAALESRPAAPQEGVKPEQVAQLSEAVGAARARLDELTKLNDRVASLSQEIEGVRKAQQEMPQPGGAGGEAGGADTGQLRARLDKLENALTTLSSATGANGQPNGMAPLAQFSSKIADLEQSLNAQITELRQGLLAEIESKVAKSAEAGQQAVAGTQRIDREVAGLKTDTARLEQRAETLKAASDKLGQTLRAVTEQAANLQVELDSLKGDVAQQFTKVARPADVDKAIAPVSSKLAAIEKDLGAVVESEKARKANAERIVLSLELANLKRVLDRGQPYADELRDVKKVAGDAVDFAALEAHASKGVASARELTRRFEDVAYRIINADAAKADGSVVDRLLAGAKSIVQVRRTDLPKEADGTEAAVARIEKNLKQGDLTKALAEAKKLPETGRQAASAWISELEARASVDQAIAEVENQLKASLGGAKAGSKEG
jgi:hypothetical protein